MKFWQSTAFNDPTELVEIAVAAEVAGFEGLLVSEHLFVPEKYEPTYLYSETGRPDFTPETPFPEPWCAISAMATATKRLRFSTMVYILPLHHPLEVSKALSGAAIFSENRVILGAGAGWMREEFDTMGVPFETRGKRFDEMIDVLRKLWAGGMVEHHGHFFDFGPLQQSPAPTRQVPIYIGGMSAPALRRAARLGDGWLGAGSTPDEAAEILTTLRTLREQAGRLDEPFEAIVPLVVPPEPDTFARLSDLGASGTVNYPFAYTIGPQATLQQKLDALAQFGETVIAPLAGS